MVLGWANHLCLGQASPTYEAIGAQAAAPVAVLEAQGEEPETPALPGRKAVAGLRFGTPEGAEAQLRLSEGLTSNESRVRRNRTLGSTSTERNRGQGGERGTGTMAKANGNSYSLPPRQARISSTLLRLTKAGWERPCPRCASRSESAT